MNYKTITSIKVKADRYLRKHSELKLAISENEKNHILRLPDKYDEDAIREELVTLHNDLLDEIRHAELEYTI